jgi:HAD superfamily hydrolase (TIGR01459 family)
MDPTTAPSTARIVAGLSELAPHYDGVLCDIWGVLHNGVNHFPAAIDALARFRAAGGRVVLITNAPRPNGPIREQLDRLRVPHEAYDNIVTSGDVTVAAIAAHGQDPLYHIGPERDLALYREVERVAGVTPVVAPLADARYTVVTGLFGDETGTPEDYDPDLSVMLARGLPLICANPDLVVHIGTTLRYCAGAIAERYAAQGGTVLYAGKPHAAIYQAALAALNPQGRVLDPNRVLAIGDALRTDIAGAVLQGLDALFVTSGIHRDEAHRTADGQLDPDLYQAMIEAASLRPLAAIPALAW